MKYTVLIPLILACAGLTKAGSIPVPNHSFESPVVPPVSPYALPIVDSWKKTAQPAWYDPSQNQDTPWDYLAGTFYNVNFPGQFIDNCDGTQAAFLFAVPEAGLFQDYDSSLGTNSSPNPLFDATYQVGRSYELTVGVVGGGGNMKPGASLQLGLYYRDASGAQVTFASTNVIYSVELFPTNTHLVDFRVAVPAVSASDPWAGKHIGIQILSTTSFNLAGGYWDLDNVRLNETLAPVLLLSQPGMTNAQMTFKVQSAPGIRYEIQAATNLLEASTNWFSVGTFTNVTGADVFIDSATNLQQRFYRARQL